MLRRSLLAAVVITLAVCALARAEDWDRYRGPSQIGETEITDLPTTWSVTDNRLWKTEIPGAGASQPVVRDGRIYVTSYSGYGEARTRTEEGDPEALMLHVTCVEAVDGSVIWTRAIDPLGPVYPPDSPITLHGYATPTPVIDEGNLYCSFGTAGIFSLKLEDGSKNWHMVPGDICHRWGCAASLTVHEDLLLINASSEANAFYAVNKHTAEEVWRTTEALITRSKWNRAWSTPMVFTDSAGETQILLLGLSTLCAFDPQDGSTLWKHNTKQGYSASNPVWHGDIIYAVTGSGHGRWGSFALKSEPDLSRNERQIWENPENGTGFSSAVYHDGYLYWAAYTNKERPSSAAGFCCMDAETGEMVYKERPSNRPTGRKGHGIFAGALLGDGKIYYVSMQGGVYVVEAKPEFKILALNKIEDDESWFNAPAVPLEGGRLLLRSDWGLHCIGTGE
jgi:hypothetical protein